MFLQLQHAIILGKQRGNKYEEYLRLGWGLSKLVGVILRAVAEKKLRKLGLMSEKDAAAKSDADAEHKSKVCFSVFLQSTRLRVVRVQFSGRVKIVAVVLG
jgi:hypothetical protein